MRISDWSSDVCSSDLLLEPTDWIRNVTVVEYSKARERALGLYLMRQNFPIAAAFGEPGFAETDAQIADYVAQQRERPYGRSEEHTSELQSLMRISYAVFCLKKKKTYNSSTKKYQSKMTQKLSIND